MKIAVSIIHIIKANELVAGNSFLQKVLIPESAGSWFVETDDKKQIAEIERLFKSRNIKYWYKND